MFERLGARGRTVLAAALAEARRLDHRHVGTEHLLLALMAVPDGVVATIFARVDLSATLVRAELGWEGRDDEPTGVLTAPLPLTPRLRKVVDETERRVARGGGGDSAPEHLLLYLLEDAAGVGTQLLRFFGVDPVKLARLVVDLLVGASVGGARAGDHPAGGGEVGPTCPGCAGDLTEGAGFWLIRAASEEDQPSHEVPVVYCRGCGRVLSVVEVGEQV